MQMDVYIFKNNLSMLSRVNTLRPRENGLRFADDTFRRIFLNGNIRISIKIPLKFVPKGPINNIPALVQIMAWRRSGGKPLSEPMMVSLLTHICVTQILMCLFMPYVFVWFRIGTYVYMHTVIYHFDLIISHLLQWSISWIWFLSIR